MGAHTHGKAGLLKHMRPAIGPALMCDPPKKAEKWKNKQLMLKWGSTIFLKSLLVSSAGFQLVVN